MSVTCLKTWEKPWRSKQPKVTSWPHSLWSFGQPVFSGRGDMSSVLTWLSHSFPWGATSSRPGLSSCWWLRLGEERQIDKLQPPLLHLLLGIECYSLFLSGTLYSKSPLPRLLPLLIWWLLGGMARPSFMIGLSLTTRESLQSATYILIYLHCIIATKPSPDDQGQLPLTRL